MNLDRKWKLAVGIGLVFLISLALSCSVFRTGFLVGKDYVELRIEATGDKNGDSWGTDVRISAISINGEEISPEDLTIEDGWHTENNQIAVVNPENPISLTGNFEHVGNISIDFIRQSGSGIVNVYVDDEKKASLDLYSEEWQSYTYEIYPGDVSILSHLFLFAFICLLTGEILYLLLCFWRMPVKDGILPAQFLFFAFTMAVILWLACDCFGNIEEAGGSYFETQTWFLVHVFFLLQGNMASVCLRKQNSDNEKNWIRYGKNGACVFLWSLYLLIGFEILNNSGGFYYLSVPALCFTLLLFWIACFMLWGLLRNVFLSGCLVSVLLTVLTVINYYTLTFRGTVFMPSDILAAGTAMNVLGQYTLTVGAELLAGIGLIISGCMFLRYFEQSEAHRGKFRRVLSTVGPVVLGLVFIYGINLSSVQQTFGFAVNIWKATLQCEEEGFALTFFVNIANTFPHKPESYSKSKIQELYEQYTTEYADEETVFPNVLVIMNESFSDLEEFDLFEASEPLTPFLDSQKGDAHALTGYVEVPVFGGGTSKTEFEFLTGVNSRDYPTSSPYDTFVAKKVPALPETMKSLGYESIALHPSVASNWSRSKGYPKLGFDEFIDAEKMQNNKLVRNFISDESFYNEIIRIDEETDAPLFLFGVTMQNHGGYDEEDYEEPIEIVSPAGDYPLATQYINLVRESDRALEEFVSYYEAAEEPAVIVFFGDHLPNVESELLENIMEPYRTGTDQDNLLSYHTPYYIWTNMEMDKDALPEDGSTLSIALLQTVVMDVAGLPKSGYQQFLSALMEQYPVVAAGCVLDADGQVVEDTQDSWLTDYEILQYDLLRGKYGGKQAFYCH